MSILVGDAPTDCILVVLESWWLGEILPRRRMSNENHSVHVQPSEQEEILISLLLRWVDVSIVHVYWYDGEIILVLRVELGRGRGATRDWIRVTAAIIEYDIVVAL